jgi:hypothetical protein
MSKSVKYPELAQLRSTLENAGHSPILRDSAHTVTKSLLFEARSSGPYMAPDDLEDMQLNPPFRFQIWEACVLQRAVVEFEFPSTVLTWFISYAYCSGV